MSKVEESKKMGLALNEVKTECILITKEKGLHKCEIPVSNKLIEQTQSFRHLGVIPTEDERCRSEIRSRIAQAKNFY